jgi:hypothetical protein
MFVEFNVNREPAVLPSTRWFVVDDEDGPPRLVYRYKSYSIWCAWQPVCSIYVLEGLANALNEGYVILSDEIAEELNSDYTSGKETIRLFLEVLYAVNQANTQRLTHHFAILLDAQARRFFNLTNW